MNVSVKAYGSFSKVGSPTRTHRDIEYEALVQITRRVRSAADQSKLGFGKLAEALHQNQSLWDTFAIDVSDRSNPLPRELKAQIIYLAEFTRHQTKEILTRNASIDPLIEVNTAIMRGLKGRAD